MTETVIPNKIILKVSGNEFENWTSVFVQKSLYQMVGSFGLTAANIFSGDFKKWDIAIGDECQVIIDDQIIITGYIDDIPITYDDQNHNIQFNGRDKTSDLVDCSFVIEGEDQKNEWIGQKIIRIIEDLANAFGIAVLVDSSVEERVNEKLPNEGSFKANEGDTVFDLIFKLCEMKAILPISYGDGWLHLTEAGSEKANDMLELGKNIKSGVINQSNRDRFSRYIVKGIGKKNTENTEEEATRAKGEHEDDVISRYRPLVILSELGGVTNDWCRDRAKWEAVNRAGVSRSIEYEVQGWTQSNGIVWPLNALVFVEDKFLEITADESWLIAAVDFILDEEGGTITNLTLVHPDAFKLPPTSEPIKTIKTAVDWRKKLTL